MSQQQILPRSMTLDEFSGLVGEWFLADCEPEPVKIRLLEATASRPNDMASRPPFVLVFYTPPTARLLDGGYVLRCGQFGPDLVHINSLMPPANAEPGFYYQAIFN